MNPNWHVYPDSESVTAACATHILTCLESALAGRGDAMLAVSGGSTPKLMFAHLVKAGFDWSRVQLFWVDERGVPPTDPQSNYRMTEENLIHPARIPQRNLHRIMAELDPAIAARRFEAEIRDVFRLEEGELPHFDVVHLGVGPDGHTASLFPGEPGIDNRDGIVSALYVGKMQQWRITLLPGVLLAARNIAVLAAGEDKAAAISSVLEGSFAPREYPAQIIAHQSRRAHWFLDTAAAARLK